MKDEKIMCPGCLSGAYNAIITVQGLELHCLSPGCEHVRVIPIEVNLQDTFRKLKAINVVNEFLGIPTKPHSWSIEREMKAMAKGRGGLK